MEFAASSDSIFVQRGYQEKSAEHDGGNRKTLPDADQTLVRYSRDSGLVQFRLWKRFHSRKNALFYKTQNGARVGDIFMSFIYTCQLCGADPFDYLTQLYGNAPALADIPSNWTPWNYQDSMKAVASARDRPA
jgi:hypothetical protein